MSRGTVLVVEDDPDMRGLIEANLHLDGFSTLPAGDGLTALELAGRERPDLILLDIQIPCMDGWEVLRRLRAREETRRIPVVVMTASALADRSDPALVEGVDAYLPKPFHPRDLSDLVAAFVVRRRSATEEIRAPSAGEERSTRVVVVGTGEGLLSRVRSLAGAPGVDLVAVVDPAPIPPVQRLIADLGLRLAPSLEAVGREEVDLVVDTRKEVEPAGPAVLSSRALAFLEHQQRLRQEFRAKESSLVEELHARIRELSALIHMARVLASVRERSEIHRETLNLMGRILDLPGALLLYRRDAERFAAAASRGIPGELEGRLRPPLADPVVEELMTLGRPVVIERIGDPPFGVLCRTCSEAGFRALAALPMQVKDRMTGFLLVLSPRPCSFARSELDLLLALAGQAALALDNVELVEAERARQALVEKLLARVISAQEEERRWMAAEIHDTVAQSLVGILTRVQTCRALLGSAPEQAEALLDSLREMVAESLREVRRMLFNLRPSSLDDLGLLPTLENYARRFEKEEGIRVHLELPRDGEGLGPGQRLPALVETTAFRIVQEALTNVKKHARAKNARVRVGFERGALHLSVADDGCGISWEEAGRRFESGESRGLQGMRERARLQGGSLRVSSRAGAGTTVEATLPLPRSSSRQDAEEELCEAVKELWKEVFGG